MRNADSTQDIDYRVLIRWFFASGARRFRKKLLLLLLLTVLAAFSEGISLWLIVPVFRFRNRARELIAKLGDGQVAKNSGFSH